MVRTGLAIMVLVRFKVFPTPLQNLFELLEINHGKLFLLSLHVLLIFLAKLHVFYLLKNQTKLPSPFDLSYQGIMDASSFFYRMEAEDVTLSVSLSIYLSLGINGLET